MCVASKRNPCVRTHLQSPNELKEVVSHLDLGGLEFLTWLPVRFEMADPFITGLHVLGGLRFRKVALRQIKSRPREAMQPMVHGAGSLRSIA